MTTDSKPGAAAREAAREIESRFQRILEGHRSAVAAAIGGIDEALSKREWLTEGRGSHTWNDETWYGEFGEAVDEIRDALHPLRKVARDLTDCPTSRAEILRARQEHAALLAEPDLSPEASAKGEEVA